MLRNPALERPALIHPVAVVISTMTLLLVFAAVFLVQSRLQDLATTQKPDALSVNYLRLLLTFQPENDEMRLELANQLKFMGRYSEAYEAVLPVLPKSGAPALSGRFLAIELNWMDANAAPASDPEHGKRLGEVVALLARYIDQPFAKHKLERLASISLAVGRPDFAATLYERLVSADPSRATNWLALAAQNAVAGGDPARAGGLYHRASVVSAEDEQAHRYALLAIDSFRAADRGQAALSLASDLVNRFPKSEALLKKLVQLALAQGDLAQARRWGRHLSALAPGDLEVLAAQLKIELGANDLEAALSLAERLLAKAPEDDAVREQAAQIAEWAEQPARALDYWVPLARKHPQGSAMDNALRLAVGVHDEARLVSLLAVRAQSQRLSTKELAAITEGYRKIRDPAGLWAFLRGYVALYPAERLAWELLAHALDEGGRLDEALAVLRQAENALGRSISSKRYQAEIWGRRKEPQRAFSALLEVEDLARKTPGSAIDYWRQYSQLARELKQFDAFEVAYDQLSQSGAADLPSTEAWIILLRERGKSANAIQIAESASTQFKEPRLRLLAMDIAAEAGRWNDVERLRQSARKTNPQYFEQNEMYWLLSASLDAKRHDTQATMDAYERALQLNPKSNTTKAAALWQLIDTGDLVRLRVYLPRWRADAREDSVLWPAYAAGFMKLGNAKLAVPWFARRGREHPHDALWLLSFADALDQAGRQDAAWKVRRHVFLALRTNLRGDPQTPPRPEYVRLLLSFDNRVNENELTALLGSAADEPTMRDLVVSWHISRQEFESARRWLLRAHAARQATPAWQQLAVALSDDDKQAVESILKDEAKDLTVGDHVRALRQVGRSAEALETLQRYIDEKS